MDAISRLPFRACHFAPAISRLSVSLVLILTCARFCAADTLTWNANAQGAFITSLCRDIRGCVWIGTEDFGVWRFDPTAPQDTQYSHFTTKGGLGDDNAYALACDKAGRIWAGTLNHGVSVYNGKTWKTYGPLDGPLGSRVFALAVNPKDGGVWGATEAGLFRYQGGVWNYFTRADGLPSDQANALAFGPDGTLYVGTQCDGIAIASPADNYQSWRVIPGHSQMPTTATGLGLPSHLINCLLVTDSGNVYAGTPTGLAESRDAGMTWSYRRGEDWKDKLAGLYPPVKPVVQPIQGDLLREDYVTSLAEDSAGHLLIGHRQQGLEVVNLRDWKRVYPGPKDKPLTDYVTALLPSPGGASLIGGYGGGLLQTPLPVPYLKATPSPTAPVASSEIASPLPAFPVPTKPPTLAELNTMLHVVSAVPPDPDELKPKVVALDDDWVTEGDWLGRYGRYWACLCAMSYAPLNYIWGAGGQKVDYRTRIGSNHRIGDKLRYYVTWPYTTNPRSLELPSTYLDSRVRKHLTTWGVNRRQSEADDHGETYPMSQDGPHVHCNLTVPPGLYILSLYDFDKDGHSGTNRFRDYRLSLRPMREAFPLKEISYFNQQPELAQSRIRDFWGGVWKRFLVRGPLVLGVQVNRNNSLNTILPAVMLDAVDEEPSPYFHSTQQKQETGITWFKKPASDGEAASRLFDKLDAIRQINIAWWAMNRGRYYKALLRWYRAQYSPSDTKNKRLLARLGTCYYQSEMFAMWEDCQAKRGLTSARQIEKQLRWDGLTDTDHDYNVITKFLADHPKIKAANYNITYPLLQKHTSKNQLAEEEKHNEH